MNPWILGSPAADAAAILLPALAGFLASRTLTYSDASLVGQAALFVTYGWIDSGHVWTTLWRSHAYAPERERAPRRLWLPLLVIGGIFLWLLAGLPGFWGFAVCATLFHNQRQLWGFVRWYERLAGVRRRLTPWLFHGFVFLPVAAYLVRPRDPGHYYLVPGDIPHFGWPPAYWALTYAWLALFFGWFALEARLYSAGRREWGRVFGLGATAVIYGWGFFFARTVMDIAFPLVLSHGVSYLAVMAQSSRRLGIPRLQTARGAWVHLLGVAFLGGVLATFLLERVDFEQWRESPYRVFICAAVALYFGPTLSHYLFDSWLWKGSHPEARLLFRPHPAGRPERK